MRRGRILSNPQFVSARGRRLLGAGAPPAARTLRCNIGTVSGRYVVPATCAGVAAGGAVSIGDWFGGRGGRVSRHGPLRPDYAGGGILNLMTSLRRACGAPDAGPWPPCALLPEGALGGRRHVVLLVVDGCGSAFLERHGRGSVMARHRLGDLTSVFPSTTASAVTTFLTGLPPSRHALTGWHMYFEEVGDVLACLPLSPRAPREPMPDPYVLAAQLFGHRPAFAGMSRRAVALAPQDIAGSAFNRYHTAGAETVGYGSMADLFDALAAQITASAEPAYFYAYYASFDALAHRYGVDSAATRNCFAALDVQLARLAAILPAGSTTLIVTADHGFIDSPPGRVVDLDRHPEVLAMLARPLCGERRLAYCYLREGCGERFEAYVRQRLGHAAEPVPSSRLVEEGWFGPGTPDPRLARRIGDYTLVMRENWTIVDAVPGEKRHAMRGVHGGTSAAEMRVPLVLLEI